ncbi:hypothetical protein HanIR_Chr12g0563801 [Helianthus annuus]|nr:hypothetical protein HanIR_Chr12g0563801 [Helianthus annuus]
MLNMPSRKHFLFIHNRMTFATYSRFGCRLFGFNLLLGELFRSEFILSQLLGFGTVEVAEAHVKALKATEILAIFKLLN